MYRNLLPIQTVYCHVSNNICISDSQMWFTGVYLHVHVHVCYMYIVHVVPFFVVFANSCCFLLCIYSLHIYIYYIYICIHVNVPVCTYIYSMHVLCTDNIQTQTTLFSFSPCFLLSSPSLPSSLLPFFHSLALTYSNTYPSPNCYQLC